jgi:NAD(P)-dependent dehydrogenase (short-subunit alcohol dehydrogenase family)
MIKQSAVNKGTAVVVGVGAETGLDAALARRFAREGCVSLLRDAPKDGYAR